ncbi:MAG: DNA methyltransferase [Candidatus Omnitrophica bacterium]|nr:DNA methyltransferase [Candidatus Omnitrophota bacterium]
MNTLFKIEEVVSEDGVVVINKERFITFLHQLLNIKELEKLKQKIENLKSIILSFKNDTLGIMNIENEGDTFKMKKSILVSELDQIIKSQTKERALYYLNRLKKTVAKIKTGKINDINLLRWKEYDEIITDSLWILNKRDTSGVHLGWYWGNFVPQIPHQMMMRYTKKGEWVLDTFVGSGTTLIECRRLGRNGLGIELNKEVAQKAIELIEKEENKSNVVSEVIVGDSRTINIKEILDKYGIKQVQLLIMHPPYHNIIKFSKDERDLSNAKSIEEFLKMFGDVVDNATPYLEKGRYLVLVIGDKYSKGEWIPLGFYCMNEVLKRGYYESSCFYN